jgi:hypothetical protein
VVSLGVDGCTRTITHLKIADNNEALTTFEAFMSGVEKYGLPDRVRTDHGGENILILRLMLRMRGLNRGSAMTGPSTSNTRAERMHRDVREMAMAPYLFIWNELHESDDFDESNESDKWLLHYLFIKRVQDQLDEHTANYNCHRLRTENNRSPDQLREERPSLFEHISADDCDGVITAADIPTSNLENDNSIARHCKKVKCPFIPMVLNVFKVRVKPTHFTEQFDAYKGRYIDARKTMNEFLRMQNN